MAVVTARPVACYNLITQGSCDLCNTVNKNREHARDVAMAADTLPATGDELMSASRADLCKRISKDWRSFLGFVITDSPLPSHPTWGAASQLHQQLDDKVMRVWVRTMRTGLLGVDGAAEDEELVQFRSRVLSSANTPASVSMHQVACGGWKGPSCLDKDLHAARMAERGAVTIVISDTAGIEDLRTRAQAAERECRDLQADLIDEQARISELAVVAKVSRAALAEALPAHMLACHGKYMPTPRQDAARELNRASEASEQFARELLAPIEGLAASELADAKASGEQAEASAQAVLIEARQAALASLAVALGSGAAVHDATSAAQHQRAAELAGRVLAHGAAAAAATTGGPRAAGAGAGAGDVQQAISLLRSTAFGPMQMCIQSLLDSLAAMVETSSGMQASVPPAPVVEQAPATPAQGEQAAVEVEVEVEMEARAAVQADVGAEVGAVSQGPRPCEPGQGKRGRGASRTVRERTGGLKRVCKAPTLRLPGESESNGDC